MVAQHLIAVDLGASSGRLIAGSFDGKQLEFHQQYRFANQPVELNGNWYWDILNLYQEIKHGLNLARRNLGALASLAVDTWGVDYGFVSPEAELLMNPHSYRDQRMAAFRTQFYHTISAQALFEETGNYPADINATCSYTQMCNATRFYKLQRSKSCLYPG